MSTGYRLKMLTCNLFAVCLLALLAIVSSYAAAEASEETETLAEVSQPADAAHTFDVIVVGAGPGGIAAAIQASRMGRTVALIEETSHVGGQLLSVTSMDEAGYFLRDGGLYKEFLDQVLAYYGDKPVGTAYWNNWSFAYEASVGETQLSALIAERQQIGLPAFRLELNTRVVSVQRHGNIVTGVTTRGLARGSTPWAAKIVVDATEYGDLLPLARAAYRVGNSRYDPEFGKTPDLNACVQDVSWPITIKNYGFFEDIPADRNLLTIGPPGGRHEYEQIKAESFDYAADSDWGCHSAYRGTPDSLGPDY